LTRGPAAPAPADSVINSTYKYALLGDFNQVFTKARENDSESIFEVQHTNDGTADWGDDNEGTITQIFRGPRGNAQPGAEVGWGFDIPTADLVAAYDSTDVRLHATILSVGDTLWPGYDTTVLIAVPENPENRVSHKYFWEYNTPDNVPAMSNDPANWRVMRYSDLLLLRAEAAVQMGDAAAALPFINLVRGRAGLAALTAVTLQDVYDERRRELALEGQRYFDIVRTGRGVAILGARGYTENKRYLPIPQLELDRCTELKQNHYFD
jgi:hypothetical protein